MTLYRCERCWLIYGKAITEKPSEAPPQCRVCGGPLWFFYAQDEDYSK